MTREASLSLALPRSTTNEEDEKSDWLVARLEEVTELAAAALVLDEVEAAAVSPDALACACEG